MCFIENESKKRGVSFIDMGERESVNGGGVCGGVFDVGDSIGGVVESIGSRMELLGFCTVRVQCCGVWRCIGTAHSAL